MDTPSTWRWGTWCSKSSYPLRLSAARLGSIWWAAKWAVTGVVGTLGEVVVGRGPHHNEQQQATQAADSPRAARFQARLGMGRLLRCSGIGKYWGTRPIPAWICTSQCHGRARVRQGVTRGEGIVGAVLGDGAWGRGPAGVDCVVLTPV